MPANNKFKGPQNLQVLIGSLLFLIILFIPTELSPEAQRLLAVFSFVVYQWLCSDTPLFISGIIGVAMASLLGVADVKSAFAPFADPIIFLFLGGFLLAKAFELTQLDQKLASVVLGLRWVGGSPKRVLLCFMLISFSFSMWISNTATVAMLLPMAMGLLKKLDIEDSGFQAQFLLALAHGATLGGNATPIGTPPNAIAIGMLENMAGIKVSFLEWMIWAMPVALLILMLFYRRIVRRFELDQLAPVKLDLLKGALDLRQRLVLIIFLVTVFLWIAPSFVLLVIPGDSALAIFLDKHLDPTNVVMLTAALLFLLPWGHREKILQCSDVMAIDWPSLLLFGSGLSLGNMLFKTGLANSFAQVVVGQFNTASYVTLLILFVGFSIIFTELVSNTAAANIFIPIIIAMAKQMDGNIAMGAIMVALACNSGFMMPVGTPPNAIVYGTGKVSRAEMMKTGYILNIYSGLFFATVVLCVHYLF